MFVAWAPALMAGLVFFFYEQYVENRDLIAPDDPAGVVDQEFDQQRIEEAVNKLEKKVSERISKLPDRPNNNNPQNVPQSQTGAPDRPPGPDGFRGPNKGKRKGPGFEDGFEEPFEVDPNTGLRRKGFNQYMRENRRYNGFEPMVGLFFIFASQSQIEILMESFTKEPNEARGYVWSFLLLQLLRRTQGWMVLILIGLIAPPLISKDIRSRAFLFYFSKPISRTDYLVGKFAVIGFFVGFRNALARVGALLFGRRFVTEPYSRFLNLVFAHPGFLRLASLR